MLNRLQNEMKTALREKKTERLSVIRMLISEVKNEAFKEGQKKTAEEVVMGYHKKLVKAAEEFASKPEFSDKVKKEIEIVSEFVPQQLTKREIYEIIATAGLTEISMKTVMPLVKGRADGKLVKEIVDSFNKAL